MSDETLKSVAKKHGEDNTKESFYTSSEDQSSSDEMEDGSQPPAAKKAEPRKEAKKQHAKGTPPNVAYDYVKLLKDDKWRSQELRCPFVAPADGAALRVYVITGDLTKLSAGTNYRNIASSSRFCDKRVFFAIEGTHSIGMLLEDTVDMVEANPPKQNAKSILAALRGRAFIECVSSNSKKRKQPSTKGKGNAVAAKKSKSNKIKANEIAIDDDEDEDDDEDDEDGEDGEDGDEALRRHNLTETWVRGRKLLGMVQELYDLAGPREQRNVVKSALACCQSALREF